MRAQFETAAALLSAMQTDPTETEARLVALLGGPALTRRLWSDLGGPTLQAKPKRQKGASSSSSSSGRVGEANEGMMTFANSNAIQSIATATEA